MVSHAAVYLLEGLFCVGSAGSAIVILLSGIEDIEVVLERESETSEADAKDVHSENAH